MSTELNMAVIKQLTGSDTFYAREMPKSETEANTPMVMIATGSDTLHARELTESATETDMPVFKTAVESDTLHGQDLTKGVLEQMVDDFALLRPKPEGIKTFLCIYAPIHKQQVLKVLGSVMNSKSDKKENNRVAIMISLLQANSKTVLPSLQELPEFKAAEIKTDAKGIVESMISELEEELILLNGGPIKTLKQFLTLANYCSTFVERVSLTNLRDLVELVLPTEEIHPPNKVGAICEDFLCNTTATRELTTQDNMILARMGEYVLEETGAILALDDDEEEEE